MPLLDLFRPPLSDARPWSGLHSSWATSITAYLNERLPSGWFANPNIKWHYEVDIPVFDNDPLDVSPDTASIGDTSTLEAIASQRPPNRRVSYEANEDLCEVQLFREDGAVNLAGAVELARPGNKDRAASRRAFASKCCSILQSGAGVLVVDVVTNHRLSLHREILAHLGDNDGEADLIYVSSYAKGTQAKWMFGFSRSKLRPHFRPQLWR